VFRCWIVIKKMEWERDDSAFMSKKCQANATLLRSETYSSSSPL
jgi:hypothetical protein